LVVFNDCGDSTGFDSPNGAVGLSGIIEESELSSSEEFVSPALLVVVPGPPGGKGLATDDAILDDEYGLAASQDLSVR
jgi:hypothetical protein